MGTLTKLFALLLFTISLHAEEDSHKDEYHHLISNKQLPLKHFQIAGYLMPKDFSQIESKNFMIKPFIESCTHSDNEHSHSDSIQIEVIFPKKIRTPLKKISVMGTLQKTAKKAFYSLKVDQWKTLESD